MINVIKLSALALLFTSGIVNAQTNRDKKIDDGKEQSITIRKSGDSKEKLTIVIDGDKVTVNGKPVENYKGDGIEILKNDDGDMLRLREPFALAPMPPGGPKMLRRNFMFRSNKALLGIMTDDADDGAKVSAVTKGSAAEKAGLKEGDVITKIDSDEVEDAEDVIDAIGKHEPNDKVTITYKRGGKESTATASLDKNKSDDFVFNNDNTFNFDAPEIAHGKGFAYSFSRKPRLGVQVQDTEDGNGAKVLDADDDTPAGKAGLKEGDIITQANGKAVKSVDDLRDAIKDLKDGDTVKLQFLRDGKSQTADVKLPKNLKTSDL